MSESEAVRAVVDESAELIELTPDINGFHLSPDAAYAETMWCGLNEPIVSGSGLGHQLGPPRASG